jgi:hypothetical protein
VFRTSPASLGMADIKKTSKTLEKIKKKKKKQKGVRGRVLVQSVGRQRPRHKLEFHFTPPWTFSTRGVGLHPPRQPPDQFPRPGQPCVKTPVWDVFFTGVASSPPWAVAGGMRASGTCMERMDPSLRRCRCAARPGWLMALKPPLMGSKAQV